MMRTKHEIAAAFDRRDALLRRVQRLERAIATAGRQYADQQGYRVALRPESLRAECTR